MAIKYPAEVLQQLFGVIDCDIVQQRANVLGVLLGMVEQPAADSKGLPSKFKEQLATMLLERLADDDLSLRHEAAKILARVDPVYSVPQLCEKLVSSNERVRSAADKTLVHMLTGSPDPTWIATMLINAARTAEAPKAPLHPGDIGAISSFASRDCASSPDAEKKVSRIMRVFELWANSDKVSTTTWRTKLIPFVVDGVLSSPKDGTWVQFASQLAERMGGADCAPSLLKSVLHVLHRQPKLDASALDNDNGGELTNLLLFQRLSPLLLLRMLPFNAFGSTLVVSQHEAMPSSDDSVAPGQMRGVSLPQQGSLFDVLFARTTTELEFDQVRRVAAELLSRLPADKVFPRVLARLEDKVREPSSLKADPTVAKVLVFVLCSGIGVQLANSAANGGKMNVTATTQPFYQDIVDLATRRS